MSELFDKYLLPLALQYGLTVFDFWEMTLKEINTYIKAIQQREKQKRIDIYLSSSLNASFIGCMLNGKQIPPIQQVFPELFDDENDKIQQEKDYKAMMLYKEQMLDFAARHNKARHAKQGGES